MSIEMYLKIIKDYNLEKYFSEHDIYKFPTVLNERCIYPVFLVAQSKIISDKRLTFTIFNNISPYLTYKIETTSIAINQFYKKEMLKSLGDYL